MGLINLFGVGMDEPHSLAENGKGNTLESGIANDRAGFFKISHGYPCQYKKGTARNREGKDRFEEIHTPNSAWN